MQIRLKKMISRKGAGGRNSRSAVWAVQGMEGVLLGKLESSPLGRAPAGWTWVNLNEKYNNPLRRLSGQSFPTRRAAIDALEAALLLEELA